MIMTALDEVMAVEARDAVRALLYERYPEPIPVSAVTAALGLQRPDLGRGDIEAAMEYLQETHEAQSVRTDGPLLVRLLPGGMVIYEAALDKAARSKLELLRLRVLQMLGLTPTKALSEGLIRRMLAEERELDASESSIHRAMTVLCDASLAKWVDQRLAILQPRGQHFLSGHETAPGVASPATI
jgi:hypothetical protein